MSDRREFRLPDEPLPPESFSALKAWLDEQRFDIVAAYHATDCWPDGADQETLHFELREPRRDGADPALYMAVSLDMPAVYPPVDMTDSDSGRRLVGFTFPSKSVLRRICRATSPIWTRDPVEPRAEVACVSFAYDRPDLPPEVLAALNRELTLCETIDSAYAVTRRLLVDDEERWSGFEILVDGQYARDFTDAIGPILREHPGGWGIGNALPDRDAIRVHGLVLFQRGAVE